MTLMYRCDACQQPIPQRHFVQLTCRIMRSHENEEQQALEQIYGDYCDGCVAAGKAMNDLVTGLLKYKGLEAEAADELARSTESVKCDGNHAMPPCGDPGCWQQ